MNQGSGAPEVQDAERREGGVNEAGQSDRPLGPRETRGPLETLCQVTSGCSFQLITLIHIKVRELKTPAASSLGPDLPRDSSGRRPLPRGEGSRLWEALQQLSFPPAVCRPSPCPEQRTQRWGPGCSRDQRAAVPLRLGAAQCTWARSRRERPTPERTPATGRAPVSSRAARRALGGRRLPPGETRLDSVRPRCPQHS